MSKRTKPAESSRPVKYHSGCFPPRNIDWSRLIPLIGPANAALARYDGLLSAIPNAAVLLSPLTTQEAVLSSRIEGTMATMGEVLVYEARRAEIDPAKEADIHEVLNYRKGMREATTALDSLPLCGRVIKQTHATLLSGVRGHDKSLGNYRTIQNYIGTAGRPAEEARFKPIEPENLPAAMAEWEKYMHSSQPDSLVQLAVIHAEFESLHPFLDGNGRMGRMLIPLFLFERKLLHSPMFYLSEHLEANRQQYYDGLLDVSEHNNWTGWCEFFLTALTEQAIKNDLKARQILELYASKKVEVVEATHSHYALAVLDFLFDQPIFNATTFIKATGIPAPTARRMLKALLSNGMLKTMEEAKGAKPAVHAFPELLNIAEGGNVF